jgi:hypothetical protein
MWIFCYFLVETVGTDVSYELCSVEADDVFCVWSVLSVQLQLVNASLVRCLWYVRIF